ncbi:MAG: type II toxin-antitoxin system RelE/ParE family toxin [Syntrophaceae bacterium]|nr:type II toxin-antitoxin system RelE/ParE family toxin [Syntrophaceae bacterium]
MAFNVKYKKSVARDIGRLDKKEARRILDKIEKDLSERAESYPALKGEFAGLRKMRVGDYRIIFTVMDKDVLILRIGHRREIYKK